MSQYGNNRIFPVRIDIVLDFVLKGTANWRSHLPLRGDYGKPEGHSFLNGQGI